MKAIRCPRCSKSLAYAPEFDGKTIACPHCDATFVQDASTGYDPDEADAFHIDTSRGQIDTTWGQAVAPRAAPQESPVTSRAGVKKLILLATLLWPIAAIGSCSFMSYASLRSVDMLGNGMARIGDEVLINNDWITVVVGVGLFAAFIVTVIYAIVLFFLGVIWFAVG